MVNREPTAPATEPTLRKKYNRPQVHGCTIGETRYEIDFEQAIDQKRDELPNPDQVDTRHFTQDTGGIVDKLFSKFNIDHSFGTDTIRSELRTILYILKERAISEEEQLSMLRRIPGLNVEKTPEPRKQGFIEKATNRLIRN